MPLSPKWLIAVCLLGFSAAPLRAQTLYWDSTSPSGNWDTTTAIWGTNFSGPFTSPWVNGGTASLDAAFTGSTATVTTAISTGNINFSGNFTIAATGGGSLTVADGATDTGSGGN